MRLSQSTILLGALLAAFIVFLAMNNRLAAYWALLTGSAAGSTSTSGTSAAPGKAPAAANPTNLFGVPNVTGIPMPGSTPATPGGGVAAPGGSGGPLSITVTPDPANIIP